MSIWVGIWPPAKVKPLHTATGNGQETKYQYSRGDGSGKMDQSTGLQTERVIALNIA